MLQIKLVDLIKDKLKQFNHAIEAFLRFGLSGVVFTILGPLLFWFAYPLGPLIAIVMAEIIVHSVRYFTFRLLVFPASKGYNVNIQRYVISALPVSLTAFFTVVLLRNRLDRTSLTAIGAIISVGVGFAWSRYVYTKPH
ncbi:MAG: hypothetical protein ACK587_04760 [Cyanobacteriota bacterium]